MATKKKAAKKSRRTTLRTSKGTKLYAVRAADGTFEDIQSYQRAHAADLRRTSKAEAAKKNARMGVTKSAKNSARTSAKTTAKKAAKKK